jgi:hypothetical protein
MCCLASQFFLGSMSDCKNDAILEGSCIFSLSLAAASFSKPFSLSFLFLFIFFSFSGRIG